MDVINSDFTMILLSGKNALTFGHSKNWQRLNLEMVGFEAKFAYEMFANSAHSYFTRIQIFAW